MVRRQRFREVFAVEGKDITISHVRRALATYVRTLARGNSVVDQFQYAGKTVAVLGRFIVTEDPKDIGRFRTPSLRDCGNDRSL